MARVDDVAAAIIQAHPGLDQMQLHKLLYLTQAASLAWFDEPAFDERIEAWTWGPVVRGIAGSYMHMDRAPIFQPVSGAAERLSEREQWLVERVLQRYGHLDGPTLATLVKQPGSPWRQARGEIPGSAPSSNEIPLEVMSGHHRHEGLPGMALTESESDLARRFLEDRDTEALADLFESATGLRPLIS